jgi:hypothetical protein
MGLVFYSKIFNASFAHVLMLWRTVTLQTLNSLEKNESRHYFDYCGIITTEYKWTTHSLRIRLFSTQDRVGLYDEPTQNSEEPQK